MTGKTPGHIQRVLFAHQGHLIDLAVARGTPDTHADMNRVIEVRKLGNRVHAIPAKGGVRLKALAHRRKHRTRVPDLRVTCHAGAGRRDAREGTLFHRGVAVPAINSESGDVVLMAEGNRLLFRLADIGEVPGAIDDGGGKADACDNEDDNEDTEFRECIAPRLEYLRHRSGLD